VIRLRPASSRLLSVMGRIGKLHPRARRRGRAKCNVGVAIVVIISIFRSRSTVLALLDGDLFTRKREKIPIVLYIVRG
jgi:hypothetical protein